MQFDQDEAISELEDIAAIRSLLKPDKVLRHLDSMPCSS